jgi:uncharacterized protein (TIGR03086 family)
MSTQPLEAAITSTRGTLEAVSKDQLDLGTPCKSWTVRDVINHVVGGQFFFASAVRGDELDRGEHDFASGHFLSEFDKASDACVAAFSAEGVMEKMITLPFGTMPGSAFVGLAATDTFVHGWDLAKATGQSTNLDPQLAEGLLAGARMAIQDSFRGDEPLPFGPEQAAPPSATAADRLAAFLGRSV